MGEWMRSTHLFPEAIVSSPALRAWQTVTTLCHAMQLEAATVNFDKHLYLADVDELCKVIAATDKAVNTLLLVGHNPGLEELIQYLTAGTLPESPDGKLLPTATLCILHLPDWRPLHEHSAQLVQLIRPKSLQ